MSDTKPRLSAALSDRYRLEHELGQGGMATVYLAEDVKHRRKVAIKVLHPELSAVLGPDRFLKEIELTASLQHPHILPLFDSGAADGLLYYVMPYVEGESLRARLTREKQLPVPDAVRIASEVAGALDYAHRRGVVHRDIKPENILLHDGRALVADFGIALAVVQAGGSRMTQTGMSLGTPQYMSPEQAMGEREISARSDLYALGCVAYEMLTGEPPFTGPSAQAIVARIMTEEPRPITPQRSTVPAHVEDAVLTALAKLSADRWGSAKEFAEALVDGAKAPRRTGARTAVQRSREPSRRSAILVGLVALLAAVAAWGWLGRPRASGSPVSRLRIAMSPGQGMRAEFAQRFSLSGDGTRIAYVGEAPDQQTQLWVRELDALDARPLPGTEGAIAPSFSPDGKWVLFVSRLRLKKMPVGGGETTILADSVNPISPGGAWLEDGTIVFTGQDFNLRTVSDAGGKVTRLPRDSFGILVPRALPRHDVALGTGCTDACNEMWVGVVNLRTGAFTRLVEASVTAWYAPTGHLVVVRRTGAVVAVPFDLDRLEVRGDAVPLFDGVHVPFGIAAALELSPAGTLLYEKSGLTFGRPGTVVRVARNGTAAPVDPNWPVGEVGVPALSPDGKRLAISIMDGPRSDVWIKELDRGALTRLTTGAGLNFAPVWRPDGAEISYVSSEGGWHIESRRPDGTGAITRIAVPDAATVGAPVWSPDGSWVVVERSRPGGLDIHAMRVGGDSILPIATGPFDEFGPALSPDGHWIAYASTESGRPEVYVRPFPDVARERIPVSRNGGRGPGWSLDGKELFFESAAQELMAVPVTWSGGRPGFGEPKPLFSMRGFVEGVEQRSFQPEPGGRSFLMVQEAESKAQPQLVLVLNWFEELKAKVGPRR